MNPSDFQQHVWEFYKENGRDSFPWRNTDNPYTIYISEIMLQQTQTKRVVPKYETWITNFPSFQSVAEADKKKILTYWQGLGYNRRALYIKETAEKIVNEYDGRLPDIEDELRELPGVGPYTAGALQAFVFSKPVVFVETNIRTVFIHHFFADETDVSDNDIKEKVKQTLPEEKIREWYWALMDYGSHLKQAVGNLNNRSKTYKKQSEFAGSNRQLRAKLSRFILKNEPAKLTEIQATFSELVSEHKRMKDIETNLEKLEEEGFIIQDGKHFKTGN